MMMTVHITKLFARVKLFAIFLLSLMLIAALSGCTESRFVQNELDRNVDVTTKIPVVNETQNISFTTEAATNDISKTAPITVYEDYSQYDYVLNTNTKKVHFYDCDSVKEINQTNKQGSNASPEELINQGYEPCGNCNPFVIKNDIEVDYSQYTYILNINSKKVHYPSCSSVKEMKETNKQGSDATPEELIGLGYEPCGRCHPFSIQKETQKMTSETTNKQIVYVSKSGKIHRKSNCSGMKHYTEMEYSDAIAAGYTLCQNCK